LRVAPWVSLRKPFEMNHLIGAQLGSGLALSI
jgi:hypothetical protein